MGRSEKQEFFEKFLDVGIVAEAYDGQVILDAQRTAYQMYLKNRETISKNTVLYF